MPAVKKKLSDVILEQMKQKIISGEWSPGDRLPSEKELMRIFGASRISVREPIKQLTSLGMLETRQGSGTYVRSFNEDSFSSSFKPMFYTHPLSKQDLLDILEVRKIEVMITGIAAEKSEPGGVKKLQKIYDEMYAAQDDAEVHLRTDLQFHIQISRMTNNPYLLQITRILYDSMKRALQSIVPIMGSKGAVYYHARLIDTISKHYVQEAKATMEQHLISTVEAIEAIPETDGIFYQPASGK